MPKPATALFAILMALPAAALAQDPRLEPIDQRVAPYVGSTAPGLAPTVTEGDGNVFTSLRDLALYETALS